MQKANCSKHVSGFCVFPPGIKPHFHKSGKTGSSLQMVLNWNLGSLCIKSVDIQEVS